MYDFSKIRILILGESHYNYKEISEYNKIIKKFNPDFYLHELVYENICLNKPTLYDRIKNVDKENLCDSEINLDIYKFAYHNNYKLIGIDLDR